MPNADLTFNVETKGLDKLAQQSQKGVAALSKLAETSDAFKKSVDGMGASLAKYNRESKSYGGAIAKQTAGTDNMAKSTGKLGGVMKRAPGWVGALATAFKLLITPVTAATGALKSFIDLSLSKLKEKSAPVAAAIKEMNAAFEGLLLEFSKVIVGGDQLADMYKSTTSTLQIFTKFLKDNQAELRVWVTGVLATIRDAVHSLVDFVEGVRKFWTWLTTGTFGFLGTMLDRILIGFGRALKDLGRMLSRMIDEGLVSVLRKIGVDIGPLERLTDSMVAQGQELESKGLGGYQMLWSELERITEQSDAARREISQFFRTLSSAPSGITPIKPTPPTGKPPIDKPAEVDPAQAGITAPIREHELKTLIGTAAQLGDEIQSGINQQLQTTIDLGRLAADILGGSLVISLQTLGTALVDGAGAFQDFGSKILSFIAGTLSSLGEAAIKQGVMLQLFGQGLNAMITANPAGAIAIGAALVVAGGALQALAARGRASSGGAGRSAESAANTQVATELQNLGRRLFGRGEEDEGRAIILQVGDRQMRGFIRDTTSDLWMRGALPRATAFDG